jgi:hypothetical protein
MSAAFAVVVALVQFTGPDGKQRIDINPAEVSSVREPVTVNQGHWAKGTNCVIVMSNGRFNAVNEGCDKVRDELTRSPSNPCTPLCAGEERR